MRAGVSRTDARLLLQHATGWSREQLLAHPDWQVDTPQLGAYQTLLARRAADEPVAYLVGEREFYGRAFRVDRRALIPRPETELLVDIGMAAIDRWRALGVEPSIVDVGTGAGAIAISVSLERHTRVVATDVSRDALLLARENARLYSANVAFVQADLLAGVCGPFNVVLANLPYVPSTRSLPADVRDYEPHVALFGGQRGTELIERFLHEARSVVADGAELAVELDEEEQAAPVAALAAQLYRSAQVTIRQDHGGYDRVVHVRT